MTIDEILLWFMANPTQRGNHTDSLAAFFANTDNSMRSVLLAKELFTMTDRLRDGHLVLTPVSVDAELQSLCEQIINAVGVAQVMGYDIVGALQERMKTKWVTQ